MSWLRVTVPVLLLTTANLARPNDHWAFQPVPPAPEGVTLDSLIERRLRAEGLKPQPPASRELLLRRIHLDLTGLAPTPEEQAVFLNDDSPDAYERVVDRLLASPHYGERWGRHWMDIWRYSDGYGLGKQLRNSTHHLWHWRDWIVDSLNADKGYDRMILEMLAGDEIAPDDPKVLAATGFLARNYYLFNRTTWLDNTIEHTGKAFLGMTFNCVKCHEHKYDPFEHADYYRLRAIFEPHHVRLDSVGGATDFDRDGLPRVYDEHLETATYLHLKGDDRQPDQNRAIAPGIPSLFGRIEATPIQLPVAAYAPGTRKDVRNAALAKAAADLRKAETRLAAARKPARQSAGASVFLDDFKKPRPELWLAAGPDWNHRNGLLARDTAGRSAPLVSRRAHPDDFAATLSFRTTGGATYKSVGIRFDRDASGREAHMVYVSAHEPGPKVQVAHAKAGQTSYPAAGRHSRPIALNHLYELEIRVRDRLLNVFLNGEFQLAYALPDRGAERGFELTAFDATVEFHRFEIRELPPGIPLEPAGSKTHKQIDPARELKLAELDVQRHRLALTAAKARIAADRASLDSPTPEAASLTAVASRAETAARVADTEYRLETIEDAKMRRELESSLAKARKQLATPAGAHTPLAGSRKLLETPEHKQSDYGPAYPRTSTGRRLAFARWIVAPDNPLAARVAVNHIWMRHVGEPFVETVSDFGLRAPEPLHRDLLDLLAARFLEDGWSMKALHKRIVLSTAYRRGSSVLDADPETVRRDPDNRHYWRMNPRRLESQLVRDNLLHIAGRLDPALGGPSLPADKASLRRSLYFRHSRDDVNRFLAQFDDADFLQCYRRAESIIPQQALALSNSALTLDTARRLAERHTDLVPSDYIGQLFRAVLGRAPVAEESAECRAFLSSRTNGRFLLAHALLNHNDFVSVR